jgi:hypothetical protein
LSHLPLSRFTRSSASAYRSMVPIGVISWSGKHSTLDAPVLTRLPTTARLGSGTERTERLTPNPDLSHDHRGSDSRDRPGYRMRRVVCFMRQSWGLLRSITPRCKGSWRLFDASINGLVLSWLRLLSGRPQLPRFVAFALVSEAVDTASGSLTR